MSASHDKSSRSPLLTRRAGVHASSHRLPSTAAMTAIGLEVAALSPPAATGGASPGAPPAVAIGGVFLEMWTERTASHR